MGQQTSLGKVPVYYGHKSTPKWGESELFLHQVGDFKWLTIGESQDLVFIERVRISISNYDIHTFDAFSYCNEIEFRFNIPTHIRQYVYGE